MTEEEAYQLWCPHVVADTTRPRSGFRSDNDGQPKAHACIASRCMAWRWLPLMADDAFKNAVIRAAAEIGDTSTGRHKAAQHVMDNRAAYGLPTKPFNGYCGLAGKP